MNLNKRTLRIVSNTISAVILIAIAFFVYIYVPNPLKATDPVDPRFDPHKFKFKDYYGGRCEKRAVYQAIFPKGSSKQFIEDVLVKSGHAEVSPGSEEGSYVYSESELILPYFFSGILIVSYDENSIAQNIRMDGGQESSLYGKDRYCNN